MNIFKRLYYIIKNQVRAFFTLKWNKTEYQVIYMRNFSPALLNQSIAWTFHLEADTFERIKGKNVDTSLLHYSIGGVTSEEDCTCK